MLTENRSTTTWRGTNMGTVGEVDDDHESLDDTLVGLGMQGGGGETIGIVVAVYSGRNRGLPTHRGGGGKRSGVIPRKSYPRCTGNNVRCRRGWPVPDRGGGGHCFLQRLQRRKISRVLAELAREI